MIISPLTNFFRNMAGSSAEVRVAATSANSDIEDGSYCEADTGRSDLILSQLGEQPEARQLKLFDVPKEIKRFVVDTGVIVGDEAIHMNVSIRASGDSDASVTRTEELFVTVVAVPQSVKNKPKQIGFKDLVVQGERAINYRVPETVGIVMPLDEYDQIRGENADRTIYLDSDYWNHGLGTKLFEVTLQIAKSLGAKEYEVAVAPGCIDIDWYMKMKPDIIELDENGGGTLVYYLEGRSFDDLRLIHAG